MYQLLPALARGGPGHPSMASLATAALVGLFAAATAWSAEPAAQEASPPAEAPAAEAPPPESPAAEASPAGGAESVDSLQLALTLQAVGRLEACAVEALRHAYRQPTAAAEGVDLAARCLVQAGQWSQSRQLLWHPLHRPLIRVSRPLRWRACLVSAVAEENQPLPAECRADLGDPRLAFLPAAQSLAAGRWAEADAALRVAAVSPSVDATETRALRADLQAWTANSAQLPAPSPLLAAALSTAVPGLGRVYLGRWQEGLTSFLLVGAPAWFAYGGFERDGVESVRGWLLATTTAVFYLGNIYGSWVGAETDRRKAEKRLRDDVRGGVSRWIER